MKVNIGHISELILSFFDELMNFNVWISSGDWPLFKINIHIYKL